MLNSGPSAVLHREGGGATVLGDADPWAPFHNVSVSQNTWGWVFRSFQETLMHL